MKTLKLKNATRVLAREFRRAAWVAAAGLSGLSTWMGHLIAILSAAGVWLVLQAWAWYIQAISDSMEDDQ